MAILWADNFQNYGTDRTKLQDGLYLSVGSGLTLTTDPDPSAGGNRVLRFPDSQTIGFPIPTGDVAEIGFSFRYWSALPVSSTFVQRFEVRTAGQLPQCGFQIWPNGSIRAYRDTTLLGDTNLPVVTPNSWNHIEARFVVDDVSGSIEVRVNGVAVLNLTGQDTRHTAGFLAAIILFTGGFGSTMFIKDFIVWDQTGSSNNTFLGSCAVVTLLPDADDSFTWAASTGSTGFNLIDDTTPNDSDYISAGDPPPSPSAFSLTNLPADIVSVKALVPVTRSRKIDGGDGNLQVGLKGTLTDLGADKPITTAFTYRWDVSELSPDTGSAWTPVEVDNVKLQVNRTL